VIYTAHPQQEIKQNGSSAYAAQVSPGEHSGFVPKNTPQPSYPQVGYHQPNSFPHPHFPHQGLGHPGYQSEFSPPGFNNGNPSGYPTLIDPTLLRAARQIYRQYYEAHPDVIDRPVGVAVNRYNYRGKLIFGKKPILLPQECFIAFEQIQSELY
jgi:hypothetical protein